MLLDVDGVLLNNDMYDSEWERLAGEAFTPLLGVDSNRWHLAQREAWILVQERGFRELNEIPESQRPAPATWWDQMHAEWIIEACNLLHLKPPNTQEDCVAIANQALKFYFENTRAIFPNIAKTIMALNQFCELHTASGNPAWIIETVLQHIGIRDIVGFPFGTDLANAYKGQSEKFYGTILERIGKPHSRVIVVDDGDQTLCAAHNLYGAITIKIGQPSEDVKHDLVVSSLAEVPQHIESLLQR